MCSLARSAVRCSALAWIAGAIGVAIACGPAQDSGPAEGPRTIALDGTQWTVAMLNGRPLVEGSNVTLAFDSASLGGYGGCNWYGSRYTLAASTISVGAAESTARGCVVPAGVADQEAAFFEALRRVAAYRMAGNRLEMSNGAGATVLVLTPRPRSAMNPADLAGTRWQLRSVGDTAQTGAPLTLELTAAGISGFAGCRDYTGTYQARGDQIWVTSIAMASTECGRGEAALLREGRYTTDLSEATYYRLSADSLEIVTAPGRRLVFVARR